MKVRKTTGRPPAQQDEDGINIAGAVNAVVSASVGESGTQRTRVSSRQRIVQRNGRTEVFEEHHTIDDGPDPNTTKEKSND